MNIFHRVFGKKKRAAPAATKDTVVPCNALNSVTFDDESVTRTMANGKTEVVTWEDLETVTIVTTDQGPFLDDVLWVLAGSVSGCVLPSEAQGMKELLPRLQALPGFDNTAVISAMSSTQNAKFVCWRRCSGL